MEESPMWQKFWVVRSAPSVAGLRNSISFPNKTRRGGCVEKERGGQKIPPGSEIEQNLQAQLETRIAGDPDDEEVTFTDVTPVQLEQEMTNCGTPVSDDSIREWMAQPGIGLRKIQKTNAGGSSPDRDVQFQTIAQLIKDDEAAGNPYFSVDAKAKEFLGMLFR